MPEFEARGRHVRLPFEIREDGEGNDEFRVEGYAAVFNEVTDIGGMFREQIAPGAFTDAIGRDDVVFLWNHDSDTVMARTRSGTLKLEQDERGLKMSASLDRSDPDVQRIYHKMKRGDVDKMSFAFFPDVEEWDDSGEIPLRTVKRAGLHDVSAVTHPAYDGTEIGLRSLEDARRSEREKNRNMAAARVAARKAEMEQRFRGL